MSKLSYRTIADERPQGKPKVYFSCHADDFEQYFDEYAVKILRIQDCAIWYESEPEADYNREDLELNLSQMQLFVMPVTAKLLTEPCRAIGVELPLAKEKHIPVLPLMMEQGLDAEFARQFGDLQYLDPNDKDESRRKFDEVLETYIKSVLVSNELAEKVRAAFDAYIFLSYRKKDRRKAQELMRLIHRNPLCRDFAIWYDEFLTPGEDFNNAIGKMLEKSDMFALVVTPNLVNEPNYVMTTEYPAAVEQEKPVLPVEMEETDREQLDKHYKSLPPCVMGEESEAFSAALLEMIRTLAVTASDDNPEHNYLIGIAYLDGIDVEIDAERALELITGAAEAGVPEAMEQLVTMYETGKGVPRDYNRGVIWREKHVEYLRKKYEADRTERRAEKLMRGLWFLGWAHRELWNLDAAAEAFREMSLLGEQYGKSGKSRYLRYLAAGYSSLGDMAIQKGDLAGAQVYYELSHAIDEEQVKETGEIDAIRGLLVSLIKLGDTATEKGDLAGAQTFYEKSLAIAEELVEKTGTIGSRRDLSVCYYNLGDTATEKGDLAGAQAYYEKCLAIRAKIAEETGTVESRSELASSYIKLGDAAKARGDINGAQAYYERCLAIREEITEKTGTIESRSDLALCYSRLGDAAKKRGDLAGEQVYYLKSLAIDEALVEETGTVGSKRSLLLSYGRIGDLARDKGDLERAQRYYEKSLAISENLAKEIGSLQAYRDLAVTLLVFGDFVFRNMRKNFGFFRYTDKQKKKRVKEMYERVIELGKDRNDDFLNGLGKKAQDILDKYF